jgi:signal transduction histidine kinase
LLQRLDNLLDVARAARGKLELFSSRIDLGERVNAGIEMIRHRIDQRGHKVEVQVEADIPIDGDARRVSQMVANLVDNAVLYSDPAAATPITVRCERRGAEAVIEVSDSGQGIAASELERVFTPFVQGPRVSAGLGLGLAFVRQVAELHHGSARARSDGPGLGSTFTITLPVAR